MTWIVVAIGVLSLTTWGWIVARDESAFFAASRRAGAVLAGLGGTAAGLSAFVFIGGPGLFFVIGAASLWIVLSAPFSGVLQCWAVGEPVVDLVQRHRCLTVPELIAARFGGGAPQGIAAVAVLLGGLATIAVQLKGMAVLGSVLLGWPTLLLPAIVLGGTLLYTSAGGMRVGLVAEAAQGIFMAFAALAISIVVLDRAGGPSAAFEAIISKKPELLSAWPASGEVSGLGWMLLFFLGTCAQPHYIQKFLFLKNQKSLRWMPLVLTISLCAVLAVWISLGVGGSALVLDHDVTIGEPDELAPAVLRFLGGPLMAIATLAVTAAVMSTLTSLLNITAASLCRDLPTAIARPPQKHPLLWARLSTLATGLIAFVISLLAGRQVALLGILGWGMFSAAFLPTILLGLRWPGATRRSAIAAMVTGLVVQLVLEVTRIAFPSTLQSWEPGLTGAAIGALVMVCIAVFGRFDTPASVSQSK